MIEQLQNVPVPILVLLILLLLWVAKEFWESKKKQADKHDLHLQQNTHAVISLTAKFEGMEKLLERMMVRINNLEDDVDALHKARRESVKNGG